MRTKSRATRYSTPGLPENAISAVAAFVNERRIQGETLHAMARRLGVTRITEERLAFEGGLFKLSDGELIIKLNADSPSTRKRFTLAHEIGHLLLGEPGLRSSCGRNQELERRCDTIAAELLMPTDEAISFVKSLGQPSPEKLRSIARKYSVSLNAAARRVHSDLQLWKCCVGLWERRPQIKTNWFVGPRHWDSVKPDAYSLDLAVASEAPVKVEEWWQRGSSAQPVSLMLQRLDDNRILGLVGFVQ